MDGVLVVDKPKGVTSHDIVDLIRKKFHIKKVGHAGTLDPQATGVLVILIGKACKLSAHLTADDKEYETILTLGVATDSEDAQGRVLKTKAVGKIKPEEIEQAFSQFLGEIKQVPPMFSALKHKGKKLYTLARRGIEIRRKARSICIYSLKLIKYTSGKIHFFVSCSKGTYVRTLCSDIAKALGYPGHLSKLRRLKSGSFNIKQAVTTEQLKQFSQQDLEKRLLKGILDESN